MKRGILAAALFATACASQPAPTQATCAGPVDHIYINARIWTADSAHPWAEALAVSGDKLACVGSNDAIQQAANASTTIIDLARPLRRARLPGLSPPSPRPIAELGPAGRNHLRRGAAADPESLRRRPPGPAMDHGQGMGLRHLPGLGRRQKIHRRRHPRSPRLHHHARWPRGPRQLRRARRLADHVRHS